MATDIGSCEQSEHKTTLRPVIGLTENLPKRDLEQITIQAIRTHRRLRNAAEARYEEWRQSPAVAACDTVGPARIAYVTAMIDMHAQQTVLSTLLDMLGHVPSVPAD
ncbi:transcriptional regulator [Mesorhizobium sp. M5C.F.Cr.IN.023.01.1.1]|uniref:transcriptional repressor TraM n=1 Tax=Mesorhizobium sp. M5C.F.Cr.IN.023.01.1.1 TaxID=2496768 RepID=UPI000FC9EB3A|nr:transcriptional repressor TraM [Mesorhizobium sp. M5C.F.Cr.IN.023.01.1.1]RUV66914.1 transcriptional regulator [Mesorhizobium sp. M5C.F.Cr.IN.023.01.1.1]